MSDTSENTVAKLTRVYVKIREKRKELAKQDDELKQQIDTIASELLSICKEQGASTIRTDFGTVSRRVSKHYWSSDWDSFFKFVKEQDAFALMQQRINNTNMAQFLEDNPDLHPPGLNADVNQTITIIKK